MGELPWDESERPSAGLDQTGPLPAGRHLVDVHNHFRQELTQLRDLLGQVSAGVPDVGRARAARCARGARGGPLVIVDSNGRLGDR